MYVCVFLGHAAQGTLIRRLSLWLSPCTHCSLSSTASCTVLPVSLSNFIQAFAEGWAGVRLHGWDAAAGGGHQMWMTIEWSSTDSPKGPDMTVISVYDLSTRENRLMPADGKEL